MSEAWASRWPSTRAWQRSSSSWCARSQQRSRSLGADHAETPNRSREPASLPAAPDRLSRSVPAERGTRHETWREQRNEDQARDESGDRGARDRLGLRAARARRRRRSQLPAAQGKLEPPCNPALAQSPWSGSHRSSYAQASSPYRGIESADVRAQHIDLPGIPISIQFSSKYDDGGRVAWGSLIDGADRRACSRSTPRAAR